MLLDKKERYVMTGLRRMRKLYARCLGSCQGKRTCELKPLSFLPFHSCAVVLVLIEHKQIPRRQSLPYPEKLGFGHMLVAGPATFWL